MENEKTVIFPNELIENGVIETTIFSPVYNEIGIAAISESQNDNYILRIYQLAFDYSDHTYIPIQELTAFSFQSYEELTYFLDRLPEMSGIDMLLALNLVYPNQGISN